MERAERSVRTTIYLLRTATTWNAYTFITRPLFSAYSLV